MELHIWPSIGDLPSLDAECLALCWLVSLMEDTSISIVPSGNIYVTAAHKLPALIGGRAGNEGISGFSEIIEFLKDHGFRNKMLPQGSDDIALRAYIAQDLNPLTLWTLYCYEENWTGFTRTEISDKFRFPMQYNVALNLQNDAIDVTARSGITSAQQDKSIADKQGISELHSKVLKESTERTKALKVPKQVMRVMTRAHQVYNTLEDCINEGELGPAQLLLGAHLALQTIDKLPYSPLETVIAEKPLLAALKDSVLHIQVNTVPSNGPRAYTAFNYLFSYTAWSIWM